MPRLRAYDLSNRSQRKHKTNSGTFDYVYVGQLLRCTTIQFYSNEVLGDHYHA
jgi:hypothetical protein